MVLKHAEATALKPFYLSLLSEIFSHKSETAVGKLIYEYSVLTVDMYVLVCLYFGEK